jgi:NAD-dependent dihydropyrimidine dehydrogenase PreA subunit
MAETKAMFIQVDVDPAAAGDAELAKKLAEICPVNIFETDAEGRAAIVEDNLDECVLCELCVQAAPPGQVRVTKLYSGETLSR